MTDQSGTDSSPDAAPGWEAMAATDAAAALDSRNAGLDEAEAERRLERYGPNALPPAARRGSLARFIDQFRSVLI